MSRGGRPAGDVLENAAHAPRRRATSRLKSASSANERAARGEAEDATRRTRRRPRRASLTSSRANAPEAHRRAARNEKPGEGRQPGSPSCGRAPRLPGSRPPSAASLAREREKRPLVEFRAAALSPAPVRRRNGRRTGTAGGRERRRRHLRPARPRQSLDFEVSPAGKGVRRPSFPPRRPSASFVRRRFPARRSGGSAP